ncbi:MAG TPA: hypothetical protein VN917_06045 [Xanthobacteraceae bacterium]|nr:hypothetical protein [Xanthobacteraceae bacterium]
MVMMVVMMAVQMMMVMVVVIPVMMVMMVMRRELHIWVGSEFPPRPRRVSRFDLPQQGESIRNRIEQLGI